MKYEVEVITERNEWGERSEFKGYKSARNYAIKQSLKKGVIETYLCIDIDNEEEEECQEYYRKGKLSIKII